LADQDPSSYRAAIVIPALAESAALPKTLASLVRNPPELLQQTLIVVVVNNRAEASAEQRQDNQQTLNWLQSNAYPQLQLACVDAASPGLEIPAREGVGLVRKIGFDLALQHLDWSQKPLLISLDADTLVADNYLTAIFNHFQEAQSGGATVPFRHQPAIEPQQEKAVRHYELYLRSYLFGLQMSASPYAYHTIGSAFACRAEAYYQAGGMNRRQAGEDFYFLQQLAKTAGVTMLTGTLVFPSPRYSERVPYGTGKAVQGLVDEGRELFNFSTVGAFTVLQKWLELAASCLDSSAERLLLKADDLSPLLRQFLQELDFAVNWSRLQENHAQPAKRLLAFHCWFDALRSRQLLTRLDTGCSRPAAALVAELLAWGGYPQVSRIDEQLRLLEQLQGVD